MAQHSVLDKPKTSLTDSPRGPAEAAPTMAAAGSAFIPGNQLNPAQIPFLQRTIGNQAVARLLAADSSRPTPAAAPTTQAPPSTHPAVRPRTLPGQRTLAPRIQRAWGPLEYGSRKWDKVVDGLRWHQEADGVTYFFFIETESELPEEIRDLEGDMLTVEKWAEHGLTPPVEVIEPPSPWQAQLPSDILAHILQFLTPKAALKSFQVCKSWGSFEPTKRAEVMHVIFSQIDVHSPHYLEKQELVEKAQKAIPYGSMMQLSIATHFLVKPNEFLSLAWREYAKTTKSENKDKSAVLYSIRNAAERQYHNAIEGRDEVDMALDEGSIYSPGAQHNMAVNKIWLLGIMHAGRNVILLAPLTPQLLTRGYSQHPELKEKGKGVSALGREVLGITGRHGDNKQPFYTPQFPKRHQLTGPGAPPKRESVTQEFVRNPHSEAQLVTIEDISYDDELTSGTARLELEKRGVHTQDESGPESIAYEDRVLLMNMEKRLRENIKLDTRDYLGKDRDDAVEYWLKTGTLERALTTIFGPDEKDAKIEARKRLPLLWTKELVNQIVDKTLKMLGK